MGITRTLDEENDPYTPEDTRAARRQKAMAKVSADADSIDRVSRSRIAEEYAALSERVNLLDQQLAELINCIGPVLSPPEPSSVESVDPPSSMSEVAHGMLRLRERLEEMSRVVVDVTSRVEL